MGEVYRAKDTQLDHEVAVKALPATLAWFCRRSSGFSAWGSFLLAPSRVICSSATLSGRERLQPLVAPLEELALGSARNRWPREALRRLRSGNPEGVWSLLRTGKFGTPG